MALLRWKVSAGRFREYVMTRVFIGIPTLNRPRLVRDTIESVRCQSFKYFRVVVSDDVSSGPAAADVAGFIAALNDPRFSFHRQSRRDGEYGQGRYLLGAAEDYEFFMILHDDDLLHRTYLEEAVQTLDRQTSAQFFVADAAVIDAEGVRSASRTAAYRRLLGHAGAEEGLFDVLSRHVTHGFAAISGTLFRRAALARSGFVDPDCFGNYPFESNVFLRLGEAGAKAWFRPRELMSVRFHPGALRNQHELHNPPLVRTVIRMWDRRRFVGAIERSRRAHIARYLRADALIRLREGDLSGARATLRRALRENPRSARAWALAPLFWAAPGPLRATLPPLFVLPNAPSYGPAPGSEGGVEPSGPGVFEGA